ncbi:AAA family ATPase [Micromonospora sp. NPDC005367]|uniref:AAA family ATPase n=1 Tax=Micromonospora sp. NPDC005367 TaxID=3155590 RepID=UPI00339F1B66
MTDRHPLFLRRLAVENFRSLRAVEVHLAPLNVLVGPNGAGKSNLLDVIAFLGDATRGDLEPALARRGGFPRLHFRGDPDANSPVRIEVETTTGRTGEAADAYALSFTSVRSPDDPRHSIIRRKEDFWLTGGVGEARHISITGGQIQFHGADAGSVSVREDSLGLSLLPRLSPERGGERVEALADLFASFRVFDVDVAAARQPAQEEISDRLSGDASNLAAFLFYLARNHPDRFAELHRDARAFIPGVESLEFTPIGGAGSGVVLNLVETGLRGSTRLREASFGSIRALALLALLYDPAPPQLTCIEEIDHGLHPHILDRIVELLRQASDRTQFLIATHSPALVNRLKPDELIVCERGEDSSSRIPAIDPDTVRAMEVELHGEIGLGELWFSGALGGGLE